jgi:hypothetical protein
MIGELLHLIRSIEKRALVTTITDSLGHSLGLRGDAASSSGSVHAKLADLKANPGTVINSIQRGTIVISGASSATATITSVATSKTHLAFLGFHGQSGFSIDAFFPRIELTNATTVTANRTYGGSESTTVSYEVIEHK